MLPDKATTEPEAQIDADDCCRNCQNWRRLTPTAVIGRCGVIPGDLGFTRESSGCPSHVQTASARAREIRRASCALRAESQKARERATALSRAATTHVEISRQITAELTARTRYLRRRCP